jgi:hypothetical protein
MSTRNRSMLFCRCKIMFHHERHQLIP